MDRVFHARNIDYVGVDISKDMLRHAREQIETRPPLGFRLIEESCFDYLSGHPASADLVVSTRFINWWDQETAQRLLDLFCAASRRYVILHIRVDENAVQNALSRALRYPGDFRKALKRPGGLGDALRKLGSEPLVGPARRGTLKSPIIGAPR